ncbi:hypothetical protein BDK51DRAFT_29898 [Blyttiomyces helicus]|uniref:Uncharacterized protein n=1 Tax=Blyttiomyces helicus TaxID=388810 RepID=A0A4P9WR77_9FUNG|nr:hypothetical protein BDK51DRAFT_29898 [Blyttiomyces helicus]|eukprot:RKO93730.1 hypothetical protein BDK51DRAFT_29898 [Blyttiomyces helicus]
MQSPTRTSSAALLSPTFVTAPNPILTNGVLGMSTAKNFTILPTQCLIVTLYYQSGVETDWAAVPEVVGSFEDMRNAIYTTSGNSSSLNCDPASFTNDTLGLFVTAPGTCDMFGTSTSV